MAREGLQQVDVGLGVVDLFPVEMTHVDHVEEAGRLDLVPSFLELSRARPTLL
jgi:hypothetical protein